MTKVGKMHDDLSFRGKWVRLSSGIASKRIVIEIDGAQHNFEENKTADKERDFDFQKLGVTVLRYTNFDINTRFNTVCKDILKHIDLSFSDLKSN